MSTTELIRYDAMCHAIAAAYEVDEVKEIRDQAIALAAYARQISNHDAEDRCAKIRVRAERQAAIIYDREMKAKGARGSGSNQHQVRSYDRTAATLADHGIPKQRMAEWRKLAEIPDKEFETEVNNQHMPTAASIVYAIRPPNPYSDDVVPVTPEALYLSGLLSDFGRPERGGPLLELTPAEVLRTMPAGMLEDVREMIPTVTAWLRDVEEEIHGAFGDGPIVRPADPDHRSEKNPKVHQPLLDRARGNGTTGPAS